MRGGVLVLVGILLVTVWTQVFSFISQTHRAEKTLGELREKLEQAKADREKFAAEVDYYAHSENLKKELKGRFNYKEPGEHMIILVNKERPTSTTSTTP